MNESEFKAFNRLAAQKTKGLLASGFLDTIGKPKSEVPIALNALEEVLFFYGGELVKGFAEELDKADANASGALTDSMTFEIEQRNAGKAVELRVLMPARNADGVLYHPFVEEGVQGMDRRKNRNLKSPFKFKFRNPSKKHVAALEKWISQKNVTAVIVVPKGISSGKLKPRSLAYLFARAGKERGLRATYFKKKTIERIIDDMKADIAKAIDVDVKVNILFE